MLLIDPSRKKRLPSVRFPIHEMGQVQLKTCKDEICFLIFFFFQSHSHIIITTKTTIFKLKIICSLICFVFLNNNFTWKNMIKRYLIIINCQILSFFFIFNLTSLSPHFVFFLSFKMKTSREFTHTIHS